MKRYILLTLLIALLNCGRKKTELPEGKRVFVLNGASETVSIIYPDDGRIEQDVLETGETPNFMTFSKNGELLILNSGYQGTPSLQVVDPKTLEEIKRLTLPEGSNPYALAVGEDKIYITSLTHDSVYVINDLYEFEGGIKTGKAPEGIVVWQDKLFVVCSGYDFASFSYGPGALLAYNKGTLEQIDSIPLPVNPQWAEVVGERLHILVSGPYGGDDGAILILDLDSLTVVDSLHIGGYPGYLLKTETQKVFVSYYSGKLLSYDGEALVLLDDLSVPSGAMGLSIDSGGLIYLAISSWTDENYIYVIDSHQGEITKIYSMGPARGCQLTLVWEEK